MRLTRFLSPLALFASCCALHASPIDLNTYYEFYFSGEGVFATPCTQCVPGVNPPSQYASAPPYTFTFSQAGEVILQDAFRSGDRFSLYDNGNFVGETSEPTPGANCGPDITACSLNPDESRGVFALGAGGHSLTVFINAAPLGTGAGFLEASDVTPPNPPITVTPEPASFTLMGTGLLGVAGTLRKRFI